MCPGPSCCLLLCRPSPCSPALYQARPMQGCPGQACCMEPTSLCSRATLVYAGLCSLCIRPTLCVQGWLPRSGLLYGTDFTLYQAHPSVAHSTFSVIVMPLLRGSNANARCSQTSEHTGGSRHLTSDPAPCGSQGLGLGPHARSNRQLDWHDLQITARVVGTVGYVGYCVSVRARAHTHMHACMHCTD
eukprot:1149339-Pelagomonas_calceolata.AAC.2